MTAIADLPLNPGIVLILAGLITAVMPSVIARAVILIAPVLGLVWLYQLAPGNHAEFEIFGYQLQLFRLDALSRVFAVIFLIAAFLGNLYAIGERAAAPQRIAAQIYIGSAVAAVLAGDLLVLFICFEIGAIASVFLIWASGTERAYRAGMRYLIVQIAAGLILLSGLLFHLAETGAVAVVTATGAATGAGTGAETGAATGLITATRLDPGTLGGGLILLALAIKCAFPFLHNWLQDAYPESTPAGTVILSVITTKLAIYALARFYAGTEFLIWIGAAMTVFPLLYALIEDDLRRTLAYILNNQLGFMVVGIGIGSELALNGVAAHAFCHILYEGLLFMAMGAVLLRCGTCKGSELDGRRLYRAMPWTAGFCLVGAAAISSVPLLNGFVSKSMIVSAAGAGGYEIIWLILLFASAGVFLVSGLRLPYAAFFAATQTQHRKPQHRARNSNPAKASGPAKASSLAKTSGPTKASGPAKTSQPTEAPWAMIMAMAITAFLCLAIGVYPAALYRLLPFEAAWHPWSVAHIINQLQILAGVGFGVALVLVLRIYPHQMRGINLDTDWIFRAGMRRLRRPLAPLLWHAEKTVTDMRVAVIRRLSLFCRHNFNSLGLFGRTPQSGNGVAWIVTILLIALLISYSAG